MRPKKVSGIDMKIFEIVASVPDTFSARAGVAVTAKPGAMGMSFGRASHCAWLASRATGDGRSG
jgi:hypothetical protein